MASKTNIDPSIWYRTKNQNNAYVFDTYNTSSHIGTNNNGIRAVTQYIPPMQAVWIRVSTDGLGGQVTFDNTMRSHPINNILKDDILGTNIHLTVSNDKNSDETILVFNDNAKNSFDSFDSPKMFVNNKDIPELYTLADSEKLVINGMKSIETSSILPLGFKSTKAGEYSITVNEINGLDGISILLEDKRLNTLQDLKDVSSYSFQSDSVFDANRFAIHLKADVATTTSTIEQSSITIYTRDNELIVKTNAENVNGTIVLFDILGRVIINTKLKGSSTSFNLPTVAGTYITKVRTDSSVETKKIIVR
jgi:hypothetical protein